MPRFGWGEMQAEGEMWDAPPVFLSPQVRFLDRIKLLFYPKKFVLYRWIKKQTSVNCQLSTVHCRILDVGCGTGGAVIDLAKLLPGVEVVGVDVVERQIGLAKERIAAHGLRAEAQLFDGKRLPFSDGYFDALYTSDVLGHVPDVRAWLAELSRVLKPGGTLAMFAESALGKHAFVRQYLFRHGLNADPHAAFHLSLYSKQELADLLREAGFGVQKMHTVFLFAFFLHPEEFRPALQKDKRFPMLRAVNGFLFFMKQRTAPVSTAAAELWGLIEMLVIGRFVESQGYIILAKKNSKL